jgi:immunity protein, SdpI family
MQTLRWLRENWLQAAILAIPFIVVAAFWDRFPERVVVQWGPHGLPSKWAGKFPGLFVCPSISVALAIFLGWIPRIDPRLRRNPDGNGRYLAAIRLSTTALCSFGGVLIAAEALGHHFNIPVLTINAVLILFLVLGNYFGTIRPNYFVGIRTPWTLESDEVWRATHRNGGRVFVAGSLALLGLQFVLTWPHLMTCFFVFVFGAPAWSYLYSYLSFRSAGAKPGSTAR